MRNAFWIVVVSVFSPGIERSKDHALPPPLSNKYLPVGISKNCPQDKLSSDIMPGYCFLLPTLIPLECLALTMGTQAHQNIPTPRCAQHGHMLHIARVQIQSHRLLGARLLEPSCCFSCCFCRIFLHVFFNHVCRIFSHSMCCLILDVDVVDVVAAAVVVSRRLLKVRRAHLGWVRRFNSETQRHGSATV